MKSKFCVADDPVFAKKIASITPAACCMLVNFPDDVHVFPMTEDLVIEHARDVNCACMPELECFTVLAQGAKVNGARWVHKSISKKREDGELI